MPGPGDIKFGADMEASAALKEVRRLSKEMGKLQKSFDKLAKAGKKGTTEKLALDKKQIELDKQRKRVLEQIMTPQEKYNRKMKELSTLLGRNKLSQDQYWRAVRKTQVELKRAEVTGTKAFGASSLRNLAAMAAGVASVTTAVSLLRRTWDDVATARKGAAGKQEAALSGLASLLQLAGGDPDKMEKLVAAGKGFYREGGAASLDEAYRTTFQMESAGVLDQRTFFANLFGITDAGEVAGSVGKLTAAMGRKEVGSAAQIVSKGLAAAGPIPGASVSDILTAATASGKAARQLGLSDEELIAAVSTTAQEAKSADVGGTQVYALLRALGRKGFVEKFKGKPLEEMLQSITEKGMTKPQLIKFFGRQEAEAGFSALVGGRFGERLAEVKQGQVEGTAWKMIQGRRMVAEVAALDDRRRELAAEELGLEEDALSQHKADAARAKNRRLQREQQGNLAAAFVDRMSGVAEWLAGPEFVTRQLEGPPPSPRRADTRTDTQRARDAETLQNAQALMDYLNANPGVEPPGTQAEMIGLLREIRDNTVPVVQ